MTKSERYVGLTAEGAVRIALGAYYNAQACEPEDQVDLVGLWMLEVSKKLQSDPVVGPHYQQIIRRWDAEERLRKIAPDNEQFATLTDLEDNRQTVGPENG